MIINLWSTPRTGSNWYAKYLTLEQTKLKSRVLTLHQYLNHFHFINYLKPGHSDWVYEYKKGYSYPGYGYNALIKSIEIKSYDSERDKNPQQEEEYRINLLELHDHTKTHLILHNHILPMSDKGYTYLFQKADKNIFLYRDNLVDQLSSYALAYSTGVWKHKTTSQIFHNVNTNKDIIKNLFDRIVYWHKLDKTNCDIIKYEDIDFSYKKDAMPLKQNTTSAFLQLDKETQNYIKYLSDQFNP